MQAFCYIELELAFQVLRTIYILCFFVLSKCLIFAQQSPSPFCASAPHVCNIDGLMGLTQDLGPGVGNLPPGFCTAFQHTSGWIAFTAQTTDLDFDVIVGTCITGNGIEMEVYDNLGNCNDFQLVSTPCYSNMSSGNTYNFQATGLCPGRSYYLVFDGNGDSSCNFSVVVNSGSTGPYMFDEEVDGLTAICEGTQAQYMAGDCDPGLTWTVIGGTIDEINDLGPLVTWDTPGMGQVCIEYTNECSPTVQDCLDVNVGAMPPAVTDGPHLICQDDAYLYPGDGLLYGVGMHDITFITALNCDSLVTLVIEEEAISMVNIQETLCFPDCYTTYDGQSFCNWGTHTIYLNSQVGPLFCDSIVELDLNILQAEAFIGSNGILDCDNPVITLDGTISLALGDGNITYEWYNEDGDLLSEDGEFDISDGGTYTLVVTITALDGTFCTDMTDITVPVNSDAPDLESTDQPSICLGDTLDLLSIDITDNNNTNPSFEYYSNLPASAGTLLGSTLVSPQSTTTYYIVGSTADCEDILNIEVIVDPGPQLIPDSLGVCPGGDLILNDILLNFQAGLNPNISYHNASPADATNQINGSLSMIQSDTSIYIIATDAGCSAEWEIPIYLQAIPDNSFSMDSITCVNTPIDIIYNGASAVDSFLWNTTNAQGMAGNGPGPHNISWDQEGMYTITLETFLNTCPSGIYDLEVEVVPPLAAPLISCFTVDDSLFFNWITDAAVDQYLVSTVFGAAGTQSNDSTYYVSGLMPGDSIEIQISLLTDGPCPDLIITEDCIVSDCPGLPFTIDPNNDLGPFCSEDASMINLIDYIVGDDPDGETYWFGPGLVDSTMSIISPAQLGAGDHNYRARHVVGACFYEDLFSIRVIENPTAGFIADSPICITDSAWVNYTGQAGPASILFWDLDGADIIAGPSGKDPFALQWSDTGSHVLTLWLDNQSCYSDTQSVVVEVDPLIQPPELICNSTTEAVTFQWNNDPNIAGFDISQLNGSPGTLLNDTTYQVTGLGMGDTIYIELTSLSANACADSTLSFSCATSDCEAIQVDIQDIAPICWSADLDLISLDAFISGNTSPGGALSWDSPFISDSTNANFDAALAGAGTWNVIASYREGDCSYHDSISVRLLAAPIVDAGIDRWLTCADSLANIGSGTPIAGNSYDWIGPVSDPDQLNTSTMQPGMYILTVRDTAQCRSSDTVWVNLETNEIYGAELLTDDLLCDEPEGSLQILNILGGPSPHQVLINGNLIDPILPVDNLLPGVYQIEISDNNTCVWDTTITIEQFLGPDIEIGPDITVYQGQWAEVKSSSDAEIAQYTWLADNISMICPTCSTYFVQPDSSTYVFVEIVDEYGCSQWDSLFITVLPQEQIYIPNAFSPNGDGVNEILAVYGSADQALVRSFQIFNRWGAVVFEATDFAPGDISYGWDGTILGQSADPAVYVYKVEIDFNGLGSKVLSGDISLIR